VRAARRDHTDPIAAVLDEARGKVLFRGKVVDVARVVRVAGLGDAAAPDIVAGGVLAGHQTEIGHQLPGVGKAAEVADFRRNGDRHHQSLGGPFLSILRILAGESADKRCPGGTEIEA
jgi:hypothetical protein